MRPTSPARGLTIPDPEMLACDPVRLEFAFEIERAGLSTSPGVHAWVGEVA